MNESAIQLIETPITTEYLDNAVKLEIASDKHDLISIELFTIKKVLKHYHIAAWNGKNESEILLSDYKRRLSELKQHISELAEIVNEL